MAPSKLIIFACVLAGTACAATPGTQGSAVTARDDTDVKSETAALFADAVEDVSTAADVSGTDVNEADLGIVRTNASPPESGVKLVAFEEASVDPEKQQAFEGAMARATERQRVFGDAAPSLSLDGQFTQGGLVFGQTRPGANVTLDGTDVMVSNDGKFVIGFGRDSDLSSLLVLTLPDGAVERRSIDIEDREFKIQRIDGLDQSKVSGFTEAQLAKINEDSAKKEAARTKTQPATDWAAGFDWPVIGRISSVFGSQRILNGEPKRPHSGVDVAAPTGTTIRAPAGGIVRLAETDMYFEGGLVLLDHGHWLESAFLHLSRIDVAPGQRVEKGDVIGAVGSTGRSTGPHLHWSIKWQGELVDPQLVVPPMDRKSP
ncbi:MAG: M23 family metallopeptidase [Pseudomonadota bacterium]